MLSKILVESVFILIGAKLIHSLYQKKRKRFTHCSNYVDDIIFSAANEYLCEDFANLMKKKFGMSMMGELMFFLNLHLHKQMNGFSLTNPSMSMIFSRNSVWSLTNLAPPL